MRSISFVLLALVGLTGFSAVRGFMPAVLSDSTDHFDTTSLSSFPPLESPLYTGMAGVLHAHVFSLEIDNDFNNMKSINVADKNGLCSPWTLVDKWYRAKETYGAVFFNEELRALVFTFRGTKNFRNVVTDIDAVEKKCEFNGYACGRIHAGFTASYDEIKRDVYEVLQRFPGPLNVIFSGHSLGGALSTIATLDVRTNPAFASQIGSLALFTTGCPQVGNKGFVDAFKALEVYSVRTVMKGIGQDPVTQLPGALGTVLAASYQHIQEANDVKCPSEQSTAGIGKCFLGDLHNPILYYGAMFKKEGGNQRIGQCSL